MNEKKSYTGIDAFRLPAALLVAAIHTSPLSSVSETGDFILTRAAARIAVPFFFMVSGFFLFSPYVCSWDRLKGFVRKTAAVYGISILLYLPVNIYSGYFAMENLMPNLIRDILLDGTFYHLWYLPASITGAAIAWYLIRRLGGKKALGAAFVLYAIGLFGDSYYGIAKQVPVWNLFYELVFQVSGYTRNGIFFAPVFFIMGSLAASGKLSVYKNVFGCALSFALMLGEALCLRYFNLQRHDSMYLFLLPCMYFLFQMLLHFRGKRLAGIRDVSMLIYIIHPMMIVVVRMAAKMFRQQELLVENSMVHYGAVCLLSVLFAALGNFLWKQRDGKDRPKRDALGKGWNSGPNAGGPETDRAFIEIRVKNLKHNVEVLQKAMPKGCRLMAVVKAEAYGHGAHEAAGLLQRMGVEAFAVATIEEGIRLRKAGVRGTILILGYTNVCRARDLRKYDLVQTLVDFTYADALNRQGIRVKAHLKIDTGMHRLGIPDSEYTKVKKVFAMRNLRIDGMFTHLSCADSRQEDDIAFTRGQIARFYRLVRRLKKNGIPVPKLHIQSSYGLLNYPELNCSYARVGIALYGVSSSPGEDTVQKLDLRPVLALKSRVVLVRPVAKGEWVGYGRDFQAGRDSRIAILSIGYGDGFPRNLSNGRGKVWIRGYLVPVIGRICMDQLAVDITDAAEVGIGDIAILIGEETGDGMRLQGGTAAPIVAAASGGISNELLCRLGARLPIVLRWD